MVFNDWQRQPRRQDGGMEIWLVNNAYTAAAAVIVLALARAGAPSSQAWGCESTRTRVISRRAVWHAVRYAYI